MADELNRLLRALRPHTKADHNWADSPEGVDALDAIHARIAAKPARRMRSWSVWLPTVGVGTAAAALITAVALSSSPGARPGTTIGRGNAPVPVHLRPAGLLLKQFDSCGQLLAGMRQHTADTIAKNPYVLANFGYYGGLLPYRYIVNAAVPDASASTEAKGLDNATTSTTNVQEVGVDEPDIVKTDGDRVVSVTNGQLRVVSASTRSVTGTLDLTLYANWQTAQLLVSGTHALVITSNYGAYYGGPIASSLPSVRPGAPPTQRSTILSIDLSDTPKVVGTLQVDGTYVDARMVGTTVRLVAASTPDIPVPAQSGNFAIDTKRNQSAVRTAPLTAWLPSYTVTVGGVTKSHDVPCTSISRPTSYSGTSMLTVYTLDVTHPDNDPMPITVAADGQTVYATQTSLYVASQPSYCFCSMQTGDTQVHRFDIQGTGRPTYLGSGEVAGSLLSSYSISDYEGHLRIATTTGTDNRVYVLDADTLKVTGQVTGLGKGERIYAVRFIGPLGYVVTFRQTDPLYVIDLRNPASPRAVGELTLTGFSSYLHDVGNGRLVGVGQEASRQGMVAGLQVSLFDVSTPSDPSRLDHDVLSNSPGESPFDPHAFLFWAPTGLLAVPVQSWDATNGGKVLVLRVHGAGLSRIGLVANRDSSANGGGILRSMIVDGKLWTLSAGGIQVTDPASLHDDDWIAFG